MSARRILGVMMFVAALSSVAHAGSTVPELDPGSAASALLLLGGAVLVIRGRIKK